MSPRTSLGYQCCQLEGKEGKRRLLGGRLALPSSPCQPRLLPASFQALSLPVLSPLRHSKSSFNLFWTRVRSRAEGSKANINAPCPSRCPAHPSPPPLYLWGGGCLLRGMSHGLGNRQNAISSPGHQLPAVTALCKPP